MIQTQLLKADQPYQIITAGGRVGIQVGTLIVTEDKTTPEGGYQIVTHSHPVVNYSLKSNREEDNRIYVHNDQTKPREHISTMSNWELKPEGAVWDKVEISNVEVLGFAGITRDITLYQAWGAFASSAISYDKYDVDGIFLDGDAMSLFSRYLWDIADAGILWHREAGMEFTWKISLDPFFDDFPVIEVDEPSFGFSTFLYKSDKKILNASDLFFFVQSIKNLFYHPLAVVKFEYVRSKKSNDAQLEAEVERLVEALKILALQLKL